MLDTVWFPISLIAIGFAIYLGLAVAHGWPKDANKRLLGWWLRSLAMQLAAVIMVLGLTLIVTNVPPFRGYLEDKLTKIVSARLDEDPNFLADTFSKEKLKKMSINTLRALGTSPSPEATAEVYDDVLIPLIRDNTRYSTTIAITDELLLRGTDSLIRRTFTVGWIYKNHSQVPMEGTYPGKMRFLVLEDRKPSEILEHASYLFDDSVVLTLRDLKPEVSEDGLSVIYSDSLRYTIPPGGAVSIRSVRTYVIPFRDRLLAWFPQPIKDLTLTYHHPRGFEPILYVFGLRDVPDEVKPRAPVLEMEKQWVLPGWFIKHHGFLLEWTTGV